MLNAHSPKRNSREIVMITLLSLYLLVAATPTESAQPSAAQAATAEAPKEEKKICKREMATESRMASKRICLTAAQWRERQTQDIKGLGLVTK